MSIEMENPKSVLELVDAAANLVAQMLLSHRMGDADHFFESHERAADLLHQATKKLCNFKSIVGSVEETKQGRFAASTEAKAVRIAVLREIVGSPLE